jgi:hypothetical protein
MKTTTTRPARFTPNFRLDTINELVKTYRDLSAHWDDVGKVFGTQDMHNSPLHEASWFAYELAVKYAAIYIGDDSERLTWFIHENDCGFNGLQTKDDAGKIRKIRTAKQLLALIDA